MKFPVILAIVSLIGCNSSTQPVELSSPTRFDGSDLPHASRAAVLVQHLFESKYRLAEYPDKNGVPFDENHLAVFLSTGELPDGSVLIGRDNVSWDIDARIPRADPAVPDTPWYYDQTKGPVLKS